jgi:tagatose-6-phosphate ketose/aldose isomerase
LLTEFEQYHRPGQPYLWISFSRSGDSPEGVALLENALEQHRQIQHLVITCNGSGRMAEMCSRHADRALALILDDAVNDRGLAMTSSFTNMVIAGQCLANLEGLSEYGEVLAQMVDAGTEFLAASPEMAARIAAQDCSRACFVGSGGLQAAAEESALKLSELSAGKVATMAESPLGLRHGPMSSIDSQTLFVAFLSRDPRRRGYELDLLDEIHRKRLARVRAIVTSGSSEDVSPLTDYAMTLNCGDRVADHYRPPLDVIFGQLLGLFASLRHGLKPDHPSPSGAITRVVAPIRIYS